jgi:hypothetical protein
MTGHHARMRSARQTDPFSPHKRFASLWQPKAATAKRRRSRSIWLFARQPLENKYFRREMSAENETAAAEDLQPLYKRIF